jgi:hypothetical protein
MPIVAYLSYVLSCKFIPYSLIIQIVYTLRISIVLKGQLPSPNIPASNVDEAVRTNLSIFFFFLETVLNLLNYCPFCNYSHELQKL